MFGYSVTIWMTTFTLASATYTVQPPCCRDHLGSNTCSRLLKTNARLFAERCNNDAEFRLLQCCTSCNKSGRAIAYDLIARSLVSQHCFDRYGPQFCGRYVNSTDVFQPRSWSCDGENPQIAFRACRQSCGFCNFRIVHYTLDNAVKACRDTKAGWRDRWGMRLSNGKDNKQLSDMDSPWDYEKPVDEFFKKAVDDIE